MRELMVLRRDFSPYVFRSSFSNSQAGHVFGDWAYKKGYRRLTILTSDYSAGYEHIGSACKVFKDAGGEIVEEIYAPLGTLILPLISPELVPTRPMEWFASWQESIHSML